MHRFRPTCLLALLVPLISTADGQTPPRQAPPATIVTLGDSITKGERAGVRADETFSALIERALRAGGADVRVVNLGVGGERTDQALQRLGAVADRGPRIVTVMYGTNDSYVDPGKAVSRLTTQQYKANLRAIV